MKRASEKKRRSELRRKLGDKAIVSGKDLLEAVLWLADSHREREEPRPVDCRRGFGAYGSQEALAGYFGVSPSTISRMLPALMEVEGCPVRTVRVNAHNGTRYNFADVEKAWRTMDERGGLA